MTNSTIPTLESISDLTAIIEWQPGHHITDDTDLTEIPNDVYPYGSELAFCVVFNGKLEAKDLPAGEAYRVFAELCAVANEAMPFDGSYFSELESEE